MSFKFFFLKFMESTDDIELFVESIIIDMNLGYENSNISVRVKVMNEKIHPLFHLTR